MASRPDETDLHDRPPTLNDGVYWAGWRIITLKGSKICVRCKRRMTEGERVLYHRDPPKCRCLQDCDLFVTEERVRHGGARRGPRREGIQGRRAARRPADEVAPG